MSRRPARRLVLAPLLVLVALSGCGGEDGDGGGDDSAAIATALRQVLTSKDPVTVCERSITRRLALRLYGSVARCLDVEREGAATHNPPEATEVSRIKSDDDRGSAYLVLRGGDQAGTRGTVTVVRQQGRWRLDDMSIAFLRSALKAGLINNPDIQPALAKCLAGKVDALPDALLKRMALGVFGAQPQAFEQIEALVGACVNPPDTSPPGEVA